MTYSDVNTCSQDAYIIDIYTMLDGSLPLIDSLVITAAWLSRNITLTVW